MTIAIDLDRRERLDRKPYRIAARQVAEGAASARLNNRPLSLQHLLFPRSVSRLKLPEIPIHGTESRLTKHVGRQDNVSS